MCLVKRPLSKVRNKPGVAICGLGRVLRAEGTESLKALWHDVLNVVKEGRGGHCSWGGVSKAEVLEDEVPMVAGHLDHVVTIDLRKYFFLLSVRDKPLETFE